MAELPEFVIVPEDLTMREVEKAIQVCMKVGLLTHNHGYVIIPQGTFVRVPMRGEPPPHARGMT